MSDVRRKLLAEASEITAHDRASSYGQPEDSFQAIADLWNALGFQVVQDAAPGQPYAEGRFLTSADVALAMICVKMARVKNNPTHRDSWVDIAGYAACGYDVAQRAEATATDVDRGEDIP